MLKIYIPKDKEKIWNLIKSRKKLFDETEIIYSDDQNDADAFFTDVADASAELAVKKGVFVVIFSEQKKFESVQNALRLGVFDYMTYPLSNDELIKLKNRLTYAVRDKKRKHIQAALYGKREKHTGNTHSYAAFLICAGAFPMTADDMFLPAKQLWGDNALEGLLPSVFLGYEPIFLGGKTCVEKIVALKDFNGIFYENIAHNILDSLVGKSFAVSIAYSTITVKVNEMGVLLEALRLKMREKILFLHSSVIGDYPQTNDIDLNYYNEKIILAAKLNDTERVYQILLLAINDYISKKATQVQICHFIKNLISAEQKRLGLGSNKLMRFALDVDYAVSEAVSNEDFCRNITYILCDIIKPQNESTAKEPPLIAEIEEYIKNNYQMQITNLTLSSKFGFVPSYISKLFRTYRGMSPTEYLQKYRIDTAIKLLSENSTMLFKEAAVRVGINDQHYFSKIFKKETGLKPSDYFMK